MVVWVSCSNCKIRPEKYSWNISLSLSPSLPPGLLIGPGLIILWSRSAPEITIYKKCPPRRLNWARPSPVSALNVKINYVNISKYFCFFRRAFLCGQKVIMAETLQYYQHKIVWNRIWKKERSGQNVCHITEPVSLRCLGFHIIPDGQLQ